MKYKITDETITHFGRTLHRIEALQDFGDVKAGGKGGYVEREINLSQSGNCWVSGDADYIVFKNWWSSGRYFTWTRSNNMWRVGCFYGTGKELIEKAYKDSAKSGREYERIVEYVEEICKENEI